MSQTSSNENGAPEVFEAVVDEPDQGLRLDVYLADQIEDASRSFIQKLIKSGHAHVNRALCKRASRTVSADDLIRVELPPPAAIVLRPEDIPIDIVYQDADVAVVNKPSGMVTHPAPGHATGTLVNALLHHCPDFWPRGMERAEPSRPGIVHRLDRFTSGVLVAAKNPKAYASLSRQAREHSFDRQYLALVRGEFTERTGRITAPVGRSLSDPTRMTVTSVKSRDAVTAFEVLEQFGVASLLALTLATGRTHQIRVHLRFIGHPVLGDPVYGATDYERWQAPEPVKDALARLEGQALHAARLGFEHPTTSQPMTFSAPLPQDFQAALDAFRRAA